MFEFYYAQKKSNPKSFKCSVLKNYTLPNPGKVDVR